ncbi:hypothetical protein [Loktanella salsilacus]|uniref:hypothetical protein n=1 Tax=Loktanella salsilacus TaxID=195913 RepID=UPI0030032C15
MNKFLATTAIASLLAMPAMAEQTDISQTVNALQEALNTIRIDDDATDVSQAAVNAANIISIDFESLDDVTQSSEDGMTQNAINDFDTRGNRRNNAVLTNIAQAGTNVLNSVDLTMDTGQGYDINHLSQVVDNASQTAFNDIDIRDGTSTSVDQDATNVMNMAAMDDLQEDNVTHDLLQEIDDSSQFAGNNLDVDLGATDIAQDAVNVMNLAEIEDDLKGDSFQNIFGDTSQVAENNAFDTNSRASITNLMQSAVNVANSLSVGENSPNSGGSFYQAGITQIYDGSDGSGQVASNFVKFASNGLAGAAPALAGDPAIIDQSALNAINLATITNVGWTVSQDASDVNQSASNVATNFDFAYTADVSNFDQSATNVANILSAGSLPDLNGYTEVSQNFSGLQSATNSVFGADDLFGVSQAATNVANSVSGL